MPRVEIFYSRMCDLCHRAMDYFDARGIDYISYEVFWKNNSLVDDDNSRRMLRLCGNVDFVPQLLIDGKQIKGWKTLSILIETGEIEEYLK